MFLTKSIEVQDTEDKGKGVFATAEIPGGTIIGDYIGIVTDAKTNESENKYEDDAVYDMWYSDLVDICPAPDSFGIHLLNCSCEPNCAMHAIGRHTIIFAQRTIFPGEELTYDYMLGEQDTDCEPGTDNCLCGSPLCRGTIYSNPASYDAWDEYLCAQLEGTSEEPPVPFGESLPLLDEYPDTIDDNPIFPMFGARDYEPMECEPEILTNLDTIRATIRKNGLQIAIPKLNLIIEGVMFGGHLAIEHIDHAEERARIEAEKEEEEECDCEGDCECEEEEVACTC